jgi:hypothetical protein
MKQIFVVITLVFTLVGCTTAINYMPEVNSDSGFEVSPKKIAIFFDGTGNDPNSDTNIKKLHSLVFLQKNRNDIATSYIKGVGTSGKVFGMAVGWGIGYDVREAYQFLINSYQPNDEIYIFGFSRGAYASRILASLLYNAGIPDKKTFGKNINIINLSDEIYSAYKGIKTIEERKKEVQLVNDKFQIESFKNVRVKALGLWDTVEALGWPDYAVDIDIPNARYADQLCNVDKVYHAVSIDDNRARVFTPILLTRKHLYKDCDNLSDEEKVEHQQFSVNEVYFAGAHSDVGGGYENNYLNGVSLNWMIGELDTENLLPKDIGVPQNKYDVSHNPESGIIWGSIYHELNRDIHSFVNDKESLTTKLKIHHSVFDRLEYVKIKDHEFKWLEHYPHCFRKIGDMLEYKKSVECDAKLEIIYNKK